MDMRVQDRFETLTAKEKQTLRLIAHGHDAKSSARSLGLSVHTINERLRDARRKMAVSSSREAARLLLEAERETSEADPDFSGDMKIGEDGRAAAADQQPTPTDGVRWPSLRWILGGCVMTLAIGLLALAAMPNIDAVSTPAPAISEEAPNAEVVETARQWLVLLDQGRWDASYQATGAAFRKLNTAAVWARASDRVRAPLGAMVTRTFLSQENLPAPPMGYEVVKFRTQFANKAEAIETVTLDREDGGWRVVGVTVG